MTLAPTIKGKAWCAALALALLAGCQHAPEEKHPDAAAKEAPRIVTQADGIELTVSTSAREIEVGQPLTLDVHVVADSKFDVDMPDVKDVLGPFEVRHVSRLPAIPEDAKRSWQVQIELMTFDAGSLEVPALTVTYHDTSDVKATKLTLDSKPISIVATSVVGEKADLNSYRDIKGAAEMPTGFGWIRWLVAGGLLAVVLAVAIVLFFVRRARRAAKPEPVLLPHEWALHELEALAKAGLIAQHAFEPFYVHLSAIVRGYVERRFGLMAPERTTDEFLREARRSRALREEHRELLGSFLRAADMVKFAKFEPTEEDCTKALASARAFVQETVPSVAPQHAQPEPAVVGAS